MTDPSAITIEPAELADRLAQDERLTVLDVRPDASWPIEGPASTLVHMPAERILSDPTAAASRLDGPVAVVCSRGVTARAVADALRASGAEAAVVDGGMRRWIATLRPRPVDVGLEGGSVAQVQRPGRGCLSYVIAGGEEALVVDPAPDAAFYADLAARMGARVTQVLDTHIHADHLSGARALAELAEARLRLPELSLERGLAYADDVVAVADGEELALGPLQLSVISLPGHTTDMTGVLIGDRAVVGGDSLFADGIARPDLQRSDPEGARAMARVLHRTLHERLLSLPGDALLLPGHAHPGVHRDAVAPTLDEVRAAVPELAIEDPDRFAAELTAEMPPRPANYEAIIAANSGHHEPDPELESGGNSCATR
jgi:glyoxylase-like metal-dependent hydrolase (beta-lactamase superfamily II)